LCEPGCELLSALDQLRRLQHSELEVHRRDLEGQHVE
jgi:hypothetical protein